MFKKLLQLKTLLVAFLVMTGAGNVWGEQAILPKTQALTTEFANVGGDSNIQIKTSSANTYTNPLRIYANTTITIKAAGGYVINSVIYEASSTGNYVTNAQNAAVTPNVTPTVSGKNVTWTLNNVTEFTFKPSSQTRANSIVINYSASTSACATPTFSPAAGTYNSAQNVTLSTTTDGATIYYTTDGTDPATSSSVYSTPISVSATTTIKAMAAKDGMTNNSSVATATYVITDNAAPSHNVTWSVNGETTAESSYKEGASISFPANPADVKGKTFVGWVTTPIAGETDTAPSFVTSATMGKSDVTYYAVFADEIPGTISNESMTIDANTTNVPTTYGNANTFSDYSLNGVQFKIQQMYKNGEKLQWRASGNNSGTGTMYNEDNLQSIQSIVLSYDSEDNNKNFTVNVGDTENPTSGTSITPSISNSTYTFNCSPYNKGYFVLTNGLGAGYLTSIVINYRVNSPSTYSAYCTAVIDAPTASVAACVFDTPFDVTITSEEGTTLKYTMDGTEPAKGTAVATNSVVLSIPAAKTRVRAIALLNGASSPELDVTYTYNPKVAPTLTVPASVDLKVKETGKTITVTTNSDGAVTFESSDDIHLLVDNDTDNKVGELLADAEGTYTVTVTVAETENYRSATADVTVNVTKTATTLTIDPTGLTNTDVYVNTAAGALAATVLDEHDAPVASPTVTWDSSNPKVATIEADGTVTLAAAGTTTLTATYAGNDTYAKSDTTYVLTVTDSEPKDIFYKVTDAGQLGDGNKIAIVSEGEDHNVAMSTTQNTNNRGETEITIENDSFERTNEVQVITLKLLEKNWRLYTGSGYLYAASSSSNHLKTQAQGDANENSIVSIAIDGGDASLIFQGEYTRNVLQYNSNSNLFSCYGSASQDPIQIYRQELPLSVSEAGYATFSSTSALDFTNVKNIYAYTATVSGNTISFQRVNKVPAETGLLLRSVNGGAVSTRVPLYDGTNYDVTGNAFVAATEEIDHLPTTDEGFTNYILNKPSDGIIGFYQANNQRVGAGKAYLHVSSEQATTRAFIAFSFDDPETGIAQVETLPQQGVAYDLQGRRVNAPKGGLYIINGKKVIVK